MLIDRDGAVQFLEQGYGADGRAADSRRFDFALARRGR
jgi:hypothetical protein